MSRTSKSNMYFIFILNQLLKYHHILTSLIIRCFFAPSCVSSLEWVCVCVFFFLAKRYYSFFMSHFYAVEFIQIGQIQGHWTGLWLRLVKGSIWHHQDTFGHSPIFHTVFPTAQWITSPNCSLWNLLSRDWNKLFGGHY